MRIMVVLTTGIHQSLNHMDARSARPGLLPGYACVPDERIAPAFATIAAVIKAHLP